MSTPSTAADSPSKAIRPRSWMRRGATGLVLATLAAGGWWGHRHDWRLTPAQGTGDERERARRVMWVEAAQRPIERESCPDHGLPVCPLCNPVAAELRTRPVPTDADRDRVREAMAVRDRPTGDPKALRLPRVIRFESAETVADAGIDITPAWPGPVREVVVGAGELGLDPGRVARVA